MQDAEFLKDLTDRIQDRITSGAIFGIGASAYLMVDTPRGGDEYEPLVYEATGPAVASLIGLRSLAAFTPQFRARTPMKDLGRLDALAGDVGEALRTAWNAKFPTPDLEEPEGDQLEDDE